MGHPKFICKKPGPKSVKIIKRDHKVISPCVTREYSFVYKKAKGMNLWDVDGRKYLDFSAGIAVMNIGHNNPVVHKALHEQIKNGTHAAFADFYAETPVRFVENLLSFLPKHLNTTYLSNSGTESVEAAFKAARWHTSKKWTVAFSPCFHGRTMGSLSMTNSQPVQRRRYTPLLPVKHSSYPYLYRCKYDTKNKKACANSYLSELEKTMKSCKGDLASVFMEPVSGEGGYIVPPKEFVKGVRELCDKHGALMCMDEVQAGCYRTGKFLATDHFGVKPDIVSLSKAIGGGVPLGATIGRKDVMDWESGAHGTTFGGNLLACAAGNATLNFMREKKLGDNATKMGKIMMKRLNEMKEEYEIIGDVRGLGLMIGVELVQNKRNKKPGVSERSGVLCKAAEKGLVLLPSGKSVIRICPPLIINKKQAQNGLDMFEDAISEINKK